MGKMKRSVVLEEYTTAEGRVYEVDYNDETVTIKIDGHRLALPLEQAREIGTELCWIGADHGRCGNV